MAYDTKYYLDQEGLELYDSKIKEHINKKVIQPDWEQNDAAAADYIKNRIGGYYGTVTQEIFNNEELDFSEDGISSPNSIIVDSNYTITDYKVDIIFDNVKYSGAFKQGNFIYYFGNGSLKDTENFPIEDTGEPFVITTMSQEGALATIYVKDLGKHTIDLKISSPGIVQIPFEFLEIPDTIARTNNYLSKYNNEIYVPHDDYHPATKLYVDEQIAAQHKEIINPDWLQNDEAEKDYIKNRIGGYYKDIVEPYKEEQVYDFTNSSHISLDITGEDAFNEDDKFIITFDNIEYKVIGKTTLFSGMPFIAFGNQYLAYPFSSLPNTGEPFCFYKSVNNPNTVNFIVEEGGVQHTVTIDKIIPELVKIPTEYLELPETSTQIQVDWNQSNETALDYIKNRPFYTDEEYVEILPKTALEFRGGWYGTHAIDSLPSVGDVIIVNWNDTEYICVGQDLTDTVGFGNLAFEGIGDGNDEPFIIYMENTDGSNQANIWAGTKTNPSANPTISISIKIETIHKLPEKYIPDTIARTSSIIQPVQSDWNQLDHTAVDFIKNKPFGNIAPTNTFTAKFTSATDGILNVTDEELYKFDSITTTATIDIFEGITFEAKIYGEESANQYSMKIELISDTISFSGSAYYSDNTPELMPIHVRANDINYPFSAGTVMRVTIADVYLDREQLLDEKYIPDTIARVKDVDIKIANLVNSAPETLNTLGELATAFEENTEIVEKLDQAIIDKADKKDIIQPVQSDWNQNDETQLDYIKNRPFYEGNEIVTPYENYQLDFTDAQGMSIHGSGINIPEETLYKVDIIESKEYTVIFDDVTYNCTAEVKEGEYIAVGNGALWDNRYFTDNGLPFCIGRYISNQGQVFIVATKEIHTVTISYATEIIHELDGKFISYKPGLNVENTEFDINGEQIIAKAGAEIFNDYNNNKATGSQSHAEGQGTTASGAQSHAEGSGTTASGFQSHAEGLNTTASGMRSHSEGFATTASGSQSHAEGQGTIAAGNYQHVQGKYNIEDTANKYAHIVGNGTGKTSRVNIHTVDWDGNGWYSGDLYVGGESQDDGIKVATINDIMNSKYNQITMTDAENNYDYILEFRGGKLASYCAATAISVTTMPTKVSYTAGEAFDPTDMVVEATCQDGQSRIIKNFTYPETVTTNIVTISYREGVNTYTTDIEVTVA